MDNPIADLYHEELEIIILNPYQSVLALTNECWQVQLPSEPICEAASLAATTRGV